MLCPKCRTEMRIGDSRYVINENKLYIEQDMYCRNKNCSNNDKIVETVHRELPVSAPQTPLETSLDD